MTKEELAAMIEDSDRCALELSDARVDVIAYACLVAIMSQGRGYHYVSEGRASRCDRCRRSASRSSASGSRPLSASVATAYDSLDQLGLKPVAPRAGALLAGRLTAAV